MSNKLFRDVLIVFFEDFGWGVDRDWFNSSDGYHIRFVRPGYNDKIGVIIDDNNIFEVCHEGDIYFKYKKIFDGDLANPECFEELAGIVRGL
jgi:hypothetical protein